MTKPARTSNFNSVQFYLYITQSQQQLPHGAVCFTDVIVIKMHHTVDVLLLDPQCGLQSGVVGDFKGKVIINRSFHHFYLMVKHFLMLAEQDGNTIILKSDNNLNDVLR